MVLNLLLALTTLERQKDDPEFPSRRSYAGEA